jgi:phosphatidylethanolamine-binding protein (PEBP) family uncharacterized protein
VPTTITVTSPAFAAGAAIPAAYTCDGADRPPPLRWAGVPATARHLDLTVTDPDAPGGPFVHWRVRGMPASATAVPAGTGGYTGPCPPPGDRPHHYRFTVTALDGHGAPIADGTLVGTYARARPGP